MENQKKELKEFDQTVACMFFADWFEAIKEAETETDRESEAYMLFKAIVNYSLYGEEPDFERYPANKSFKRFWPMLLREMDASIKNRKRGFKDTGGPTENGKKVIAAYRENPRASLREISDKTGVSKSEVQRVKRKYLSDTGVPDADAIPVPDTTPDGIPIPDADASASAYTYTGTGHGTGRDTGQPEFSSRSGELGAIEYNSPEKKYTSIADWHLRELRRWKEITPPYGTEIKILARYLSTHKETALEEKFGYRFGRYILGWDSEKQEPIIGYRFGFAPLKLLRHNIADIPKEYADYPEYGSDEYYGMIIAERKLNAQARQREKDLLEESPIVDGALPF